MSKKVHYSPKATERAMETYRGARNQQEAFCGSSGRARTWFITSNKELVTCEKCTEEAMERTDKFFTWLDESVKARQEREAAAAKTETIQEQVTRELAAGIIRPLND